MALDVEGGHAEERKKKQVALKRASTQARTDGS
jgi:hypothetical protein